LKILLLIGQWVVFLGVPKAEGAISILMREFMTKNIQVLKNNSESEISKYNHLLIEEKRPWTLIYDYGHLNNALDSTSSTFNSQNLITNSHTLGIGREFTWGGAFNFENSYTKVDRSRYSTAFLGASSPVVYEFSQSVGYSQTLGKNFFGRTDRAELKASENLYQLNAAKLAAENEQELKKFYQNYLSAQLNNSLQRLQEQAYGRAVARKKLIQKRVKDGIREKVDLLQAEYSEISQQEKLQISKKETQDSIQWVSNLLHRKLTLAEVLPLSYEVVDQNILQSFEWKKNKALHSVAQKVAYFSQSMKKNEFALIPEITLSTQYKTNRFHEDAQVARKEGILGNDADEIVLGLNLTWTIGQKLQKLEVAKDRVNFKVAQLEQQKIEYNIGQTESFLKSKISILEENIKSVSERKGIATKVLKEYTRLYQLGRADLDQLIRAEENLIATEVSHVNYLANREMIISELASLYGVLEKYLINKKK